MNYVHVFISFFIGNITVTLAQSGWLGVSMRLHFLYHVVLFVPLGSS